MEQAKNAAPPAVPSTERDTCEVECPHAEETAQSQEFKIKKEEHVTKVEIPQQDANRAVKVGNELHFQEFDDLAKFVQDVEAGIIPPPGLSESNANPWKKATKRIMQEIAENATNPNKEIDEAWRTGKISKRQAKNLKATVRKLQG